MQTFTLHTHTVGFDGANTIAEMTASARTAGFSVLGVSNHFIVHPDITRARMYPHAVRGGYDAIYLDSFDRVMEKFRPHYAELRKFQSDTDGTKLPPPRPAGCLHGLRTLIYRKRSAWGVTKNGARRKIVHWMPLRPPALPWKSTQACINRKYMNRTRLRVFCVRLRQKIFRYYCRTMRINHVSWGGILTMHINLRAIAG